ncbi:MAG: M16 family metallopeptidase [Bdellovibrionales bacterium]
MDIQEVVSDSGITAWLVEDHSIPVISVEFAFVDAGSKQDGAKQQGLARMLSNTLDEGAGDLDSQAFQKELQDLSIGLSFRSSRDDFGGSLKTLSKHKARAFELLHLALTEPRFDNEAIARMRKANQARIRSSLSDPDWIAARLMNDVAFAGHVYGLNSGGTLSSLEGIKAEDLQAFRQSYLGRNNLRVAVSGDITADALKSVLDAVFSDLPEVSIQTPDRIAVQNVGKIFTYDADIPQTIISLIENGIARTDPDYHYAQVLNFIFGSSGFGSRLTEEIREKRGLTYGVYSQFLNMDHLNALSISTSTKNENVAEVLLIIRGEIEKILALPVTPEELNDAKAYLIGSLPLSLTSTDKIASLLLSLQVDDLPMDYLDTREAVIRSATTDDLSRVAQRILNPNGFVTLLVGKPQGVSNTTALDALPNVE